MIIQNKSELATTQLRKDALDMIEVGIDAVNPSKIMNSVLTFDKDSKILNIKGETYDLNEIRVFVIGGGKAAGAMAKAIELIIPPEDITDGVVNCNTSCWETEKIKVNQASHPIPDARSITGVKEMLALKDEYSINENDLVLCLLSGGGSALLTYPVDGVGLEDMQIITDLLISSGANIHEINTVRRHLSKVKGGGLGLHFSPAKVVALIISDVVGAGNDLSSIASGPTVHDPSTPKDAINVLKKFELSSKAPETIINHLKKSVGKKQSGTKGSMANCMNLIIADNKMALDAMVKCATEKGLSSCILTHEQTGDTGDAARKWAKDIKNGKFSDFNVLFVGGETTPKLPECHGKGGRNQHFIAESLSALVGYPGEWVVSSVATDGADFMQDVAGAIIDNDSFENSRLTIDEIRSNIHRFDSYSLLETLGNSLIRISNTGTNIGDIVIYILK